MNRLLRIDRARRLVVALVSTLALLGAATPVSFVQAGENTPTAESGGLLVYHQITNRPAESLGVGYPVLSADGTTAAFASSPASGDPANPNRIFVVDADGGEPTEVDAYQTLCYCGSVVDVSADGQAVVSTEGVQIRIADGGSARELIVLASGEIGAVRITGDGQTVFFLVRRDTGTLDGSTLLARGVWAIDAGGDNLRQVIGAAEVAEAIGVPIEETGCCFYGDGMPLDVSADGGTVVVGAYAGGGEHVLAVDGAGGNVRRLVGPGAWVKGAAISADGGTVGYHLTLLDNSADEIGVVDAGGGEPRPLTTGSYAGFDEPLSVSADGAKLLLSPNGLLFDTDSGEVRQLGIVTPGADGHTTVLTEGLARATTNAEATRFLYAIRTVRCADCANAAEQLAVLDVDPSELGEAPLIAEASVEPDEIPLEYAAAATASAEIAADGTLVAVGLVALRDGMFDVNVAFGAVLHDDGQNGDARANDGVFTNNALVHGPTVLREDDTGPRLIRVQAEVETAAGLRHATALDFGTLTVVEGA